MSKITQIGFYPDPPSRRLAYDADGTRVFWTSTDGGTISEFSTSSKSIANNESGDRVSFGSGQYYWLTFIFPQKINLTHFYFATDNSYTYNSVNGSLIQWSNNTNTAFDGNWEQVATWFNAGEGNPSGATGMRTNLEQLPLNGIKAIRFRFSTWYNSGADSNTYLRTCHLWGHKTAGEAPDRIDFTDIDGAEFVNDLDFGDQPRNTDRIWTPSTTLNQGSGLYLRNRSLTRVANDVSLLFETKTGVMQNLLALSKDGTTFGTQISYAEIQPQQIVGPVYLRQSTTSTTTLGMWASRLRLAVGHWL